MGTKTEKKTSKLPDIASLNDLISKLPKGTSGKMELNVPNCPEFTEKTKKARSSLRGTFRREVISVIEKRAESSYIIFTEEKTDNHYTWEKVDFPTLEKQIANKAIEIKAVILNGHVRRDETPRGVYMEAEQAHNK